MFDSIAGLPVHPLVVHAVVVLALLAALLLVTYVLKPAWQRGLQWPLLGLSTIAAISAFVATQSGEALEHRVGEPGFDHAARGDLAAISTYVMLGAVGAVIFWLAAPGKGRSWPAIVLGIGAAAFVLTAVILAGHSGASSAWNGVITKN